MILIVTSVQVLSAKICIIDELTEAEYLILIVCSRWR